MGVLTTFSEAPVWTVWWFPQVVFIELFFGLFALDLSCKIETNVMVVPASGFYWIFFWSLCFGPELQNRNKCDGCSCKRFFFIEFFWSLCFGPELQNRNECAPLDFSFSVYIHVSWTLGKPYGIIKPRCYWEHIGSNAFGNSLGTLEPFGNLMGIREVFWKSLSPQKEKTGLLMRACWALPIGCMKFPFPKLFVTIFGLG
jgi:hypothetical protein